jgi:hypothetical protein
LYILNNLDEFNEIFKIITMKVIQFIHPGSEHTCMTGSIWNTGAHKRKYLELSGNYLTDLSSEPLFAEKLYFWGEWEAQSHCRTIPNPIQDGPHFIFNPYYQFPLPANAANTDPFVFGSQFYYCFCKQPHYPSLRNLEPGDVILFGSCKNFNFVLDTVFVVKRRVNYKIGELDKLMKNFNQSFSDVSLLPLLKKEKCEPKHIRENEGCFKPDSGDNDDDDKPTDTFDEYSIYEAVMYKDRNDFNGMFSYAPSLADERGEAGFARPTINIPNVISPTLNQGLKITVVDDTTSYWASVTEQVLHEKLELMIENNLA